MSIQHIHEASGSCLFFKAGWLACWAGLAGWLDWAGLAWLSWLGWLAHVVRARKGWFSQKKISALRGWALGAPTPRL